MLAASRGIRAVAGPAGACITYLGKVLPRRSPFSAQFFCSASTLRSGGSSELLNCPARQRPEVTPGPWPTLSVPQSIHGSFQTSRRDTIVTHSVTYLSVNLQALNSLCFFCSA